MICNHFRRLLILGMESYQLGIWVSFGLLESLPLVIVSLLSRRSKIELSTGPLDSCYMQGGFS